MRAALVPGALLAAPLAAAVALFVLPLADMASRSVHGSTMTGRWTTAQYERFFGDPFYLSSLAITLGTATLVTLLTIAAAFPVAYAYWQASARRRSLLVVLLLSPFYANVVVKVFGWMVLLPPSLRGGFWAIVLVDVHRSMPFMVLTLAAAMTRIGPELLESARICGASGARLFRTVVLPLSMPGVVAGGILVFSLTVASFVVPMLVGGRVGGRFLPVLLYQQITVAQDWGFGAAMGMVLMVAAMLAIVLGDRWVRSGAAGRVMGEGLRG